MTFKDRWFKAACVGAILAGICCFTPSAVIALTGLGLISLIHWIEFILLPVMILCGVVMAMRAKHIKNSRS